MKIGLVGCGNIARIHAEILRRRFRDDAFAFCDRDRNQAEKFAMEFGPGRAYGSLDECLSSEKLDALHILTQVSSHAELAKQTLAAGAHVYLEKPAVETKEELADLRALSEGKDLTLCAGYSTLGTPAAKSARSIIRSGRFGEVVTVHCDFNFSVAGGGIPYGQRDHWAYSLTGGILNNVVDHPVSVVLDAMHEIDGSSAHFGHRHPLPNDSPDLLHISVRNRRQIGSCTVSFGHGSTQAEAVYCLEGATIRADFKRQLLSVVPGSGPEGFARRLRAGLGQAWDLGRGTVSNAMAVASRRYERHPGISGLIANFYAALEGREPLIVDLDLAARQAALLERVWSFHDG